MPNRLVSHFPFFVHFQRPSPGLRVQGVPSGEAFIQMDSEYAAELASTTKTKKLYIIGGAKRYIEVIQCCGEDMNAALNNGLAPPSAAAAAAGNAGALQAAAAVQQTLSIVSCIPPSSSLVLPAQAHIIAAPPVPHRPYLSPGPFCFLATVTVTVKYHSWKVWALSQDSNRRRLPNSSPNPNHEPLTLKPNPNPVSRPNSEPLP